MATMVQLKCSHLILGGHVHAKAMILKPVEHHSLLAALGVCTIMAANLHAAKSQENSNYLGMTWERY